MKAGRMKRSRAFRRAQIERKKNKFRKASRRLDFGSPLITEKELQKWVGLKASTPKLNQCECCCNPRHSTYSSKETKLTMQERRAKRKAECDISDIDREEY